ncbi:hypothetical protein EYF80_012283 [Liparis tanakae]|uniref:Uncharacterized protein n=1 Tax=Liparis tanakae TaxID=230148 RepID=A0A4Z2IHI7_9TELE|nr:hypothetical protein EYF80_012283 [Liparis tanakae]
MKLVVIDFYKHASGVGSSVRTPTLDTYTSSLRPVRMNAALISVDFGVKCRKTCGCDDEKPVDILDYCKVTGPLLSGPRSRSCLEIQDMQIQYPLLEG